MRRLVMWLSLVMVIFLAACGGNSNDEASGNDSGGESGDKITLRMSWWGSQARHDMTNEIIALYEEQNPNIDIQAEFTGFDGYFEKMAAQAAGNNLPDIMQQNFGEFVNQYASQDLLTDLTPFVEDGTINLEGVEDTVVDSGKVNGTLVGIPTGTNSLVTNYDPDLFEEAGVEPPTNDWTWEEYVNTSKQIHEATGKYGTRLAEPANMFEYYLREKGQKLFNEDGSGLGYEDDQLLTDYFAMIKDLVDSGAAPGYDVIQQIKGLEDELIAKGETGLDPTNWSNQVGTLTEAAGKELGLLTLPGENNEQGMYLKPSMLWSIGNNSEHKEEAAKFINFFTNTVEVFEIIGADRGVPIKPDIREALEPNLSEADKRVFEYIEYVGENSTPADTNFPPQSSEVLSALESIDELVMYGEVTPAEGAEQFRQQAESILGN